MAASDPAAAAQVLSTIEEAAARTLVDMRSMVGSLRGDDDDAELAPQPGLREIASLAGTVGTVDIVVDTPSDVSAPSAVGAALYRIAQESVTNAVRHANNASTVNVQVTHGDDAFQLTVLDNGRATGVETHAAGYGLVGMAERARLLGGTLDAGPAPAGGWLVEAKLPVAGSVR